MSTGAENEHDREPAVFDSGLTVRNWAGNVSFAAASFRRPSSLEQLQELVAASASVHALGTGHSFSGVADTEGVLVSLDAMPAFVEIDEERQRVRVSAATPFALLAAALQAEGLALRNLASLPHIGVAGACATGTHGSGDRNPSLAALVAALELVTADGELAVLDRSSRGEELAGAVVACGALGIVHALTFDVVDSFEISQVVYEGLELASALSHLDELLASGYSVSLFLDWSAPRVSQLWCKQLAGAAPATSCLGAPAADGPRHPIAGMPPAQCTSQLGLPGAWNERLPHFRADQAPSVAGDELQSEYLVARSDAPDALAALAAHHGEFAHLVHVGEVRSVAADALWLSPSEGRDSVAIHFTWRHDAGAVAGVLPRVEALLAPFTPRPHWGKLFATDPCLLAASYPRLDDFSRLIARRDPQGKFANAFSRRYLAALG